MDEPAVEPAVEPVAPIEPASTEPVELVADPVIEEPAGPVFDPAELDARFAAYDARNQQLEAALTQLFQPQPTVQQPQPLVDLVDEFGQVNPDALVQMLEQRDQRNLQVMQQLLAPVTQTFQQQQQDQIIGEGEQRLGDILADDISRNGEFATDQEADKQARTLVRTLAEQSFPEIAGRYGGNWNPQTGNFDFPTGFASAKAAEQAMTNAAAQVRSLLKATGSAAVSQHVNHNATLAGQRTEPGAAAGIVTTDPAIRAPGETARLYAAGAQRISTAA